MADYIALIHKEPDSDYGVSFPDFPGCVTAGATLDEARAEAVEALGFHLEGLREDGAAIPAPSALEEIMEQRENRDAVAVLVAAPDHSAKSVRVNITLPEDVLAELDRYAQSHGFTRSGLLLQGARRMMTEAA
jgi:predicted RNase H-like HicB family nuclease